MSVFSSNNNLLMTLLITLPFLFITIIISFLIYKLSSSYYSNYKISEGRKFNNTNYTDNNKNLNTLFYLIIFVQTITPIIFLLFDIESIKLLIPTIINNSEDILFTLTIVFISSFFMILFSSILAYASILNKKFKSFCILLSIILLGIPSSFIGIAIINMYNTIFNDILFYSAVPASHALLLRFIPISFFIIFSDLNKYSKEYFDISILNTNNLFKIFKNVILPNSYFSLIYAFITVSILGIGELGATIMVIPPGKSTLSMTIYSYLHYGSSSSVKGLSLFIFISCILSALIFFKLLSISKGDNLNYE
jgi:iron(III) transport system permease protein